jgi:hypothetical protein
MLKDELNKYLNETYPKAKLETGLIGIETHIRFELGDGHRNGTKERVNHSSNKSLILFEDAFGNPNDEVWVLVYDFNSNAFYGSKDFLYLNFPKKFEFFESFTEDINCDENGEEFIEKQEIKIAIGKFTIKDINIKDILTAIANTEMGFEPSIDQRVYFFNTLTNRAFHMYDDRGCYIWSNAAQNIKDIYVKRNDWIVDYHRPEIDKYFE